MSSASFVNGNPRGWRGAGWVSQAIFDAGCGVVCTRAIGAAPSSEPASAASPGPASGMMPIWLLRRGIELELRRNSSSLLGSSFQLLLGADSLGILRSSNE